MNVSNPALYLFDPTRILFSLEYGKNYSSEKLRMREQNTNRAVPLHAVLERRT